MSDLSPSARATGRWSIAVFVFFGAFGFGFGSWLSRLPAVRDHLGASTFEMSIFGLVLAIGALTGLTAAGRSVQFLGPRRALLIFGISESICLPLGSLLLWNGLLIPGLVLLFAYGCSFGTTDVAMNVSGAEAERALRKPRMPQYHAAYSLGNVLALGIGALAETLDVIVPIHLTAVYVVIAIAVLIAVRAVPKQPAVAKAPAPADPLPAMTGPIPVAAPTASPGAGEVPVSQRRSVWKDPRIVSIGLITLVMALAEGVASDWLPLALTNERAFPNDAAAIMLAVFFISMTTARLAGSVLISRFGRVAVLRVSAISAIIGVLIVILVPGPVAITVGTALWGVGCAFGFPIGISAAADDPATAVRAVAAVSTISYGAFLAGPMVIGILGEHWGLLSTFWIIVVGAVFVVIAARMVRPPAPDRA